MNILYIFPRIVDDVLQNTTENEIARSLVRLGCHVETVQAYRQDRDLLDGFSMVRYIKVDRYGWIEKLRLHGASLRACITGDWDIILFSYSAAHLIPFAAMSRALKRNLKLVLDIRSVPVDLTPGIRSRILKLRYNAAIKIADLMCDGITTITPMLRDTLKPGLPRLGTHVGVWASGVDLDHFKPGESSIRESIGLSNKRIVLYHGVLSPNRGIQNVIRSIEILSTEMDNLYFLVVGDGSGRAELESLATQCGVAERVIFTGYKPYRDIPGYIAAADVGILSFPDIQWWTVSSPIKLMEYLAMGLPLIATDIPATRIVIDNTGGALIVPNDQPESLAEGIRRFFAEGCKPVQRDILEKTISWNEQGRRLLAYLKTI